MVGNRYELPFNRSYLNGRVRPWTMKHRLSDLMRVLRRSVELATESGRSWTELWSAIFDPDTKFIITDQTAGKHAKQDIDSTYVKGYRVSHPGSGATACLPPVLDTRSA